MKKVLLSIGIALVISPIIYAHFREIRRRTMNAATHTVLPIKKNDTL